MAGAPAGLEALAQDGPQLERPMKHGLDQRAAVATVGVAGARTGITCTQHIHQSAEKHRSDVRNQACDVPCRDGGLPSTALPGNSHKQHRMGVGQGVNRRARVSTCCCRDVVRRADGLDPLGSRSSRVEAMVRNAPGKRLVLVLNKVDLVPRDVRGRV